MARIRSIHPGLFTDETFVTLTPAAQILWIGLWCECDDQGVFEWRPVTLKMRILPASTESLVPLLEELKRADCIKPYTHDGRDYGVVRNFVKYQRPKSPKEVHPLPPALRNFAGFNGHGTRPNATTGRKPIGTGSEQRPDLIDDAFGTSSDIAEDGRGAQPEHGGDEEAPIRNEFRTSSEVVPESPLRGRGGEEEGRKSPSRGQTFQDGGGGATSPARTPSHAHEHAREGRAPTDAGPLPPPDPAARPDNAPFGRDAAAGGAR